MDDKRLIGKKEWKIIGAFAVVFIIATIVITIIKLKNIKCETDQSGSSIETQENERRKVSPDNLGINSLNDTYDTNDLKITKQTYNTTSYELASYPVISGLKDKEFENEINQKIKSVTVDTGKSINCYVEANFSNVLSIYYYTPAWEMKTINYDLANKKELKFEDLFTNTANIKNIIYKSAYYTESKKHVSEESARNKLYNSEEEGLKAVYDYESGKEIEFYFSASTINFLFDKEVYEIDIQENYKDIAIFNRFKTKESIFDGSYEGVKKVKIGINTNQYTEYLFKQAKENLYICYAMPLDSATIQHNQDDAKQLQKSLFKIWENNENNIEIYDDMGKCYSKVVVEMNLEEKNGGVRIVGKIKTTETQSRVENYDKYMESYGLKGLTYTQLGFIPAYFDYENKWTYNEEIPSDYKQNFETASFIYDAHDNTIKIEKFYDEENNVYTYSEYNATSGELIRVLKMKYDTLKSDYIEVKDEPEENTNTIDNTTTNEIVNDISVNEIEGPENNLGNHNRRR